MELPTTFQQFIHTSRYAKWIEAENRRETWNETVTRYMDYMQEHLSGRGFTMPPEMYQELHQAILNLEVFPSMRAIMTAGPALERDNVAGFNCSYLPIDNLRCLDEMMYILMCGTGVGYSVEQRYVKQISKLPLGFRPGTCIVVEDSREGWATAFREWLEALWRGEMPTYDTSKLREAGARLKTFGGRSSGPKPLEDLFEFTKEMAWNARGRQLTSLEVHDLCCKIGDIVVVGGVRRSALISLTDLEDQELATAKAGEWYLENKHRSLANISVAYDGTPERSLFDREWQNLIDSGSGERGVFNREAAIKQVASTGRRDTNHEWGTNPCSEIILRPFQFCNLSTIVVREDDTFTSLARKARLASILGTMQASLTHFPYLRDKWRQNTEEEALLGVSMTGQMGNLLLSGQLGLDPMRQTLSSLKQVVTDTNKEFAGMFGINPATAATCVKPEGTSSSLAYASSGMHTWHAPWYVRTVRGDKKDALTQFLIDAGVPCEDDLMNEHGVVFSFPMQAPTNAITRTDLTAIEHLEIWLAYQDAWCEHKPSITVSVRQEEWAEVGDWVYSNFDRISGIAFLPYSDHTYRQAPFQDITKSEYEELVAKMPEVDFELLKYYETEDGTTGTQSLACVAGACDIVDIGGVALNKQ